MAASRHCPRFMRNAHPAQGRVRGVRLVQRAQECARYDARAQARWIDFPGNYHNGAGNLSFADGHSEIHRWLDARTKPPIRYTNEIMVGHILEQTRNPDGSWKKQPSGI